MSVDLANPDRNALDAGQAKALASQIIAGTPPEEEFDAGLILEKYPALAEHQSIVVDLAYEEFCRRAEAGEPADPNEFARRFPGVAESLLEVLEVHEYLDQHPDAFMKERSPAWPEAGEQVAGFALVREIGRGGFSRVFLAREKGLGDRHVVVKICKLANEEAAWLGQLDHPHVVPVHSVTILPRRGFTVICMPYLGSATLADVIGEVFAAGNPRPRGTAVLKVIERANQRHGLPANEREQDSHPPHWTQRRGSYAEAIVQSGAEICEALAYAHRKGIHHCDVKPSNVLLTNTGRSLLLDFNLSRQHGDAAAIIGGTLPYMAPEQLQVLLGSHGDHLRQIDARTDLFAFGVTMFQTLTGQLPFAAGDPSEAKEVSARRLIDQQRQAENLRGELERVASPAVAGVVSQCLAFAPDDRPASAQEVARRLRDDLRAVPRIRRWVRSHRVAVTAATLALALAACSAGVILARLPPRHVRYCQAGIGCLEAGDYSAARGWFDQAIDARDGFAQAIILRGWAKLRAAESEDLSEPDRAALLLSASEDFAATLIQTDDSGNKIESPEAAASLAYCLTQMKNYEEAKNCFAQAVEQGLPTPAVLNNLGYCLNVTGDLAGASERLRQAIETAPTLQAAHHNLAIVQWRLAQQAITIARGEEEVKRKYQAAIGCIESARRLAPRSAELEFTAAQIYAFACHQLPGTDERQERIEKALRCCQAAVELGLDPQKLQSLQYPLATEARFQKILKSGSLRKEPSTAKAAASAIGLVDIYPDIRKSLLDASR